MGLFKEGGGGSRYEEGLLKLRVFTKTLEAEGMVCRETAEVVWKGRNSGARVAYGLTGRESSRFESIL